MSDGAEERKEREMRIEEEKRKNREAEVDAEDLNEWEPERADS
jgi:uncharacterized protein with von Willebrand factor type A (vWA) domain